MGFHSACLRWRGRQCGGARAAARRHKGATVPRCIAARFYDWWGAAARHRRDLACAHTGWLAHIKIACIIPLNHTHSHSGPVS